MYSVASRPNFLPSLTTNKPPPVFRIAGDFLKGLASRGFTAKRIAYPAIFRRWLADFAAVVLGDQLQPLLTGNRSNKPVTLARLRTFVYTMRPYIKKHLPRKHLLESVLVYVIPLSVF
jgi:hypothetical protein